MKHIHFDVESDGFYGAYWACKDGSDCTVIAMLGDDPEDYMARSAVKWLLRLGVNILTMSPAKKDYAPGRRGRNNVLSNRHFTVQIDVLNRINQLHAVGHGFLKRLTAQDQPHAARAFVDHRRTHRV